MKKINIFMILATSIALSASAANACQKKSGDDMAKNNMVVEEGDSNKNQTPPKSDASAQKDMKGQGDAMDSSSNQDQKKPSSTEVK